MKSLHLFLALILTGVFLTPAVAQDSKKVDVTYLSEDRAAKAPGDAEVKAWLEAKFGFNYNRIDVPLADLPNRIKLLLATGEGLDSFSSPVFSTAANAAYSFTSLIDDKKLLPLDDLLAKFGKNILKEVPSEMWNYAKGSDGKIYGIPEMGFKSKFFLFIRQDWLDKVGLKAPKTMAEFEKVLIAFRDKDPGGNGKGKTYPLYSLLANNYVAKNFLSAFVATGDSWYVDKAGNLVPCFMNPGFTEYLTTFARWYKEGLIHPDFLSAGITQEREAATKGITGIWSEWYTRSYQNEVMSQNPNAKVSYIPFPVGPSGTSGAMSDFLVRSNFVILAKAKPDAAAKLVELLNWYATSEGTDVQWYGVPGKHWVKDAQGVIRPAPGIDPAAPAYKAQLYINGGNSWKYFSESSLVSPPLTSITRQASISGKYPSIDNVDYMFPYDLGKMKSADQLGDLDVGGKMYNDMFAKIILGSKPIAYLDEWIAQWKAAGGDLLIKEKTEQYNALKAKYGKK